MIYIGQEAYVNKIIQKFNMKQSKTISVPADPHTTLTRSTEEEEIRFPYREAVGSLIFAAIVSRPDIAYAVEEVSKFLDKPANSHVEAVKRIIRYLKGTAKMIIEYGADTLKLIGYTVSDFARNIDTRKSTTGFVFTLGGGAITWQSDRQSVVALSTTEAEFIASCEGAKEVYWLCQDHLLKNLGHE